MKNDFGPAIPRNTLMFFWIHPYSNATLSALPQFIADCSLRAAFLLGCLPAAAQENGPIPVENTLCGLACFALVTVWLLLMCSRMIRQHRSRRSRSKRRRIYRSRQP